MFRYMCTTYLPNCTASLPKNCRNILTHSLQ